MGCKDDTITIVNTNSHKFYLDYVGCKEHLSWYQQNVQHTPFYLDYVGCKVEPNEGQFYAYGAFYLDYVGCKAVMPGFSVSGL